LVLALRFLALALRLLALAFRLLALALALKLPALLTSLLIVTAVGTVQVSERCMFVVVRGCEWYRYRVAEVRREVFAAAPFLLRWLSASELRVIWLCTRWT